MHHFNCTAIIYFCCCHFGFAQLPKLFAWYVDIVGTHETNFEHQHTDTPTCIRYLNNIKDETANRSVLHEITLE